MRRNQHQILRQLCFIVDDSEQASNSQGNLFLCCYSNWFLCKFEQTWAFVTVNGTTKQMTTLYIISTLAFWCNFCIAILIEVMKMQKIVARAGIKPRSLAFQASVLTIFHYRGSLTSPPYPHLTAYAVPCLRGQCRLIHYCHTLIWHPRKAVV